ncbi:MAG TPA: alpha/beta fold hydrolase [Gemmatimonadaceae bacterium]
MSLRSLMSLLATVAAAVALLIILAAVVPARTTGLVSRAAPATSYGDAVQRIARRQQADDLVAADGGRSIFLTHGDRSARAVVLLHGFTNSPRQFEHLAAMLYAAGDNVYVPRLPHHAERNGTAKTLGSLTAEELRDYADSAMDVAEGLGDSVVVAGLSAGGTVAAWIAQTRRDAQRVVIIAPLLAIARVPQLLETPLMNLALRVPNVTQADSPDRSRPDRELGVSSRAIAQVMRLGTAVRRAAAHASPLVCQIVFVTNANDKTVKTAPVIDLARVWARAGSAVTVYEFPRSLGLAHDIAEEIGPHAQPLLVYPELQALIHGTPPLGALAGRRILPAP